MMDNEPDKADSQGAAGPALQLWAYGLHHKYNVCNQGKLCCSMTENQHNVSQ